MKSKLGDKQRLEHMIDACDKILRATKNYDEEGMRNIIVHEYFGIDNYKVWQTITNDIPKVKADCENALKEFL
jgi:uncharacterized protein with HEPN domain